MKRIRGVERSAGFWLGLAFLSAWAAFAAAGKPVQATGTIEFVARIKPTDGRAEPVRQFTFYLLRKSFDSLRKEAEQSESKPDLDKFVDALEVSPELKAWMKKNHWVDLSGTAFLQRLKPADIVGIPELLDAYVTHNSGFPGLGFPTPKFRERDQKQNPEKYKRQREEYLEELRRYMSNHPESLQELDVDLDAINPGPRWAKEQTEAASRIHRRMMALAMTRYLAAQTDTDLNGRGTFREVPPGTYWVGTLDSSAAAGDVRLRWDTPVEVQAGQMTRIELSNFNAAEPPRPAH